MCDGQQNTKPDLSSCAPRGCRPQQARLALSLSLARALGRPVQNAAAQGQHIPCGCRVSVSRADIPAHDEPVSDQTCVLSARRLSAQCSALRSEGFVQMYRHSVGSTSRAGVVTRMSGHRTLKRGVYHCGHVTQTKRHSGSPGSADSATVSSPARAGGAGGGGAPAPRPTHGATASSSDSRPGPPARQTNRVLCLLGRRRTKKFTFTCCGAHAQTRQYTLAEESWCNTGAPRFPLIGHTHTVRCDAE
jgi:hypothetical protein